jgi:predicted phage terminase large subunit-like protein
VASPKVDNEAVKAKLLIRDRARTDKLYLACKVLGYDFQADVHSELFSCFIPFDNKKAWREQSAIKDRLVIWPRGHYKSTSCIVEIIQAIINFPDIRILIMQGSLTVTQNLLREIKSHFLGNAPRSKFREIFPEFCEDKLGTQNAFTTPARLQKQLQQQTVTVASPNSVKTGQHYDIGFFDDLINDQNYTSAKQLAKVADQFRMCIPLIDPGCYRYVTGTRYAFGDLYEDIIRANTDGKWTITVKDCFSDDGLQVRFEQRTLPDGRLIGYSREQLLSIQREDPKMFSSQFLNKPANFGTQLFTESRMLQAVVPATDVPALSPAILFIDLASSESARADDSVILCGKTDQNRVMYVVDGIGGQWTPAQLAEKVVEMALKHRPVRILIEKTASSAYFTEYLRMLCRDKNVILPIDYIPVNNSKDAKKIRISALEGHIRNKRLRFFVGLPCWLKMLSQFTEFPQARYGHDDYPDTVALMAQVFGTSSSQTFFQNEVRHPLLIEMERQQNRLDMAKLVEQVKTDPDEMGCEFAA